MTNGKDSAPEDWLDFIVDTLTQLDQGIQGAFLQKFLLNLVGLEVSEKESITHWEGILARQSQLAEKLGRSVTLRTAAVDYFGELRVLRSPILMEYEGLKKLRQSAATDSLTGLNNRRMFEEYLHREIDRSTRYGSSFALLLLDLRKFKSANDTYGHATGDEILRSVARASREIVRGSDIACRTGGDEFAILLPQAERSTAEVLAERIARKFEECARSLVPNAPVGIDYGIAIFPEDGHDATRLCARADETLYASKRKASKQPAGPTPEPHVPASQTESLIPKGETVARPSDEGPPLSPVALVASVKTGEQVRAPVPGKDGRRYDRINLEQAHVLGTVRLGEKIGTVKVLDLSGGGVCLLADQDDLPETFPARLRVPLLPKGELTLHRVYSLPLPNGKRRVGCSFTPIPVPYSA